MRRLARRSAAIARAWRRRRALDRSSVPSWRPTRPRQGIQRLPHRDRLRDGDLRRHQHAAHEHLRATARVRGGAGAGRRRAGALRAPSSTRASCSASCSLAGRRGHRRADPLLVARRRRSDLSAFVGDMTVSGALVRPVFRADPSWGAPLGAAVALLVTSLLAALYPGVAGHPHPAGRCARGARMTPRRHPAAPRRGATSRGSGGAACSSRSRWCSAWRS